MTLQNKALEMAVCLIQCGITKPLTQLKIDVVPNLVQSIALQATVLKVKAALDQFMDGLKEAGLLSSIQEYPHLFKDLFVKCSTGCLDSGMTLYYFHANVRWNISKCISIGFQCVFSLLYW